MAGTQEYAAAAHSPASASSLGVGCCVLYKVPSPPSVPECHVPRPFLTFSLGLPLTGGPTSSSQGHHGAVLYWPQASSHQTPLTPRPGARALGSCWVPSLSSSPSSPHGGR